MAFSGASPELIRELCERPVFRNPFMLPAAPSCAALDLINQPVCGSWIFDLARVIRDQWHGVGDCRAAFEVNPGCVPTYNKAIPLTLVWVTPEACCSMLSCGLAKRCVTMKVNRGVLFAHRPYHHRCDGCVECYKSLWVGFK